VAVAVRVVVLKHLQGVKERQVVAVVATTVLVALVHSQGVEAVEQI
jgi:hypothetical protein